MTVSDILDLFRYHKEQKFILYNYDSDLAERVIFKGVADEMPSCLIDEEIICTEVSDNTLRLCV